MGINDAMRDESRVGYIARLEDELERTKKRYHFLLNQFQSHMPQMDGNHSWRFRHSGWPMQHFRGPTIEAAIENVMAAIKEHELAEWRKILESERQCRASEEG